MREVREPNCIFPVLFFALLFLRVLFAGGFLDEEVWMKIRAGRPEFSSTSPAPRRSAPMEYIHIDIKTKDSGRHILRF